MALVGDLKDISVATLIQLNCVEKNTGQLTVSTAKGPAVVYLNRGDIIDALFAGTRGEEALYRILSLAEGEFRVTGVSELPDRTIFTSWQSLLLEGMRVIDETQRGKTKIAEAIGNELNRAAQVESFVIASRKGDVIATKRVKDADKLVAGLLLVTSKAHEVSSRLGLGEMTFARLVSGRSVTFFVDCGEAAVVIVTKKGAQLEPVNALVDDVRKKLKYIELAPVQQGVEIIE
jgi:predicted regulator of Ras-like GTPase activity (Roadblock/LC7/MglB family)